MNRPVRVRDKIVSGKGKTLEPEMNSDKHRSDAVFLCLPAFICGSIQCLNLSVCNFPEGHPFGFCGLTELSAIKYAQSGWRKN